MHGSLILELRPSRALLASVLVAHLAAALALFHVPALGGPASPAAARAPAAAVLTMGVWGLLAISLLRFVIVELGKRGMRLVFEDDGHVEVALPGRASPLWCRVRAGTAVDLQWAIWFGLEPAGGEISSLVPLRKRRLMLVRGNLDHCAQPSWRQLKIWLRHKSGRGLDALPTPP